jgi:hypothetical protein
LSKSKPVEPRLALAPVGSSSARLPSWPTMKLEIVPAAAFAV